MRTERVDRQSGPHWIINQPPLWVDHIDAIQDKLSSLKRCVRDTETSIRRGCVVLFDAQEEKQNFAHLQSQLSQCSTRFKVVYQQVERFKQTYGRDPIAARALLKVHSELSEMFQKFRISHQQFTQWSQRSDEVISRTPTPPPPPPHDSATAELAMLQHQHSNSDQHERHKEIIQLTSSIQELSDMFTQLSTMVLSQGELVDRIDVNIEQTLAHVQDANEELKPAEAYSRSNSKMKWCCILWLAVVLVGLLIAVVFKFKNRQ
jgi:hypothetical protein